MIIAKTDSVIYKYFKQPFACEIKIISKTPNLTPDVDLCEVY